MGPAKVSVSQRKFHGVAICGRSKCRSVNVLFVSAEVAPFAKTGGLGDVGAALPRVLATKGHDVSVLEGGYAMWKEAGLPTE